MDAPAALHGFVEREYPRLVRAVDLLLDDRGVAEEVAQEALLRAAGRWEHVSGLESPGGWVHRVAVNLATSHLRRRRVARRARRRLAATAPGTTTQPDTATAVTVRAALARLPANQRRLLVLRHVLGWSAVEIGDLDRVRPETVRQRLGRARNALREELGPDLAPAPAPEPTADDHEERRHANETR